MHWNCVSHSLKLLFVNDPIDSLILKRSKQSASSVQVKLVNGGNVSVSYIRFTEVFVAAFFYYYLDSIHVAFWLYFFVKMFGIAAFPFTVLKAVFLLFRVALHKQYLPVLYLLQLCKLPSHTFTSDRYYTFKVNRGIVYRDGWCYPV